MRSRLFVAEIPALASTFFVGVAASKLKIRGQLPSVLYSEQQLAQLFSTDTTAVPGQAWLPTALKNRLPDRQNSVELDVVVKVKVPEHVVIFCGWIERIPDLQLQRARPSVDLSTTNNASLKSPQKLSSELVGIGDEIAPQCRSQDRLHDVTDTRMRGSQQTAPALNTTLGQTGRTRTAARVRVRNRQTNRM